MSPETDLDIFCRLMSLLFDKKPGEIRKFLKEKYGVFRQKDILIYLQYLVDNSVKDEKPAPLPEAPKPITITYFWENFECPICGDKVQSDHSLDGPYTRTRGWTCYKGGRRHFLMAKANAICARKNQPMPNWTILEELDAKKSE